MRRKKNQLIAEGVCDETDVANNFVSCFSAASSNSNQAIVAETELVRRLSNYVGSACDSVALIDVVLVDHVIRLQSCNMVELRGWML